MENDVVNPWRVLTVVNDDDEVILYVLNGPVNERGNGKEGRVSLELGKESYDLLLKAQNIVPENLGLMDARTYRTHRFVHTMQRALARPEGSTP